MAGGAAAIGGPFALTDGAGRRVTDAEVITGPTLVYFGYSFCPDVCPMDLVAQRARRRRAGRARDRRSGRSSSPSTRSATRPRWCATSPRRSTPALVGLTGTRRRDRRGGGGLQGLLSQERRRSGLLPDGPLDLHLPDGAGDGLPRVLPLGGDPRAGGRIRWPAMPPGSDPEAPPPRPVPPEELGPDRSLLILDDDEPFLRRLGRAMEKRGFEVTAVDSVAAARRGGGEPAAGLRRGRPAPRGRQRPRGGRGAARSGGPTRGSWC